MKSTFQVPLSNDLTSFSQVSMEGLTSAWFRVLRDMNLVNLLGFLPEETMQTMLFISDTDQVFQKPKGKKHKLKDEELAHILSLSD